MKQITPIKRFKHLVIDRTYQMFQQPSGKPKHFLFGDIAARLFGFSDAGFPLFVAKYTVECCNKIFCRTSLESPSEDIIFIDTSTMKG